MIKVMHMEREEMNDIIKKFRKQAESSYSFAKYECHKYAAVVSNEKILNVTLENLRYFYNGQEDWKQSSNNLTKEC